MREGGGLGFIGFFNRILGLGVQAQGSEVKILGQ